MNYKEIRERHTTFTYESFETGKSGSTLDIFYRFHVSPDINFESKVTIPIVREVDETTVANFAFHLGIIEGISYWKATCSPEVIIKAGSLNDKQIKWWHDLFIHGLGEFYYQNNINFTEANFVRIASANDAPVYTIPPEGKKTGNLIMVGGGKDSAVTMEILANDTSGNNAFMLNPTIAARRTTRIGGFRNPLVASRTLDNKLFEMNESGFLNGHTPFSAYLSFLGLFTAYLNNYKNLITSNETSASEGSLIFHGVEVNHQYSKSYRYEKMFREYAATYLTKNVFYFSLLRPLYEVQISALFSQSEKYDQAFNSCNMGRNEYWCGQCPKCAFVYLSLSPFISKNRRKVIFGDEDFFEREKIQKHILDLVGLEGTKPFDCVGTADESKLAILLAIHNYNRQGLAVPELLRNVSSRLGMSGDNEQALLDILSSDWNEEYFLPDEYNRLLRKKLSTL